MENELIRKCSISGLEEIHSLLTYLRRYLYVCLPVCLVCIIHFQNTMSWKLFFLGGGVLVSFFLFIYWLIFLLYRELSDKQASTETSLILGDAYMNIQETEKAITIYEQALKKNPKDSALASKIGQAYVKTHQYGKVT